MNPFPAATGPAHLADRPPRRLDWLPAVGVMLLIWAAYLLLADGSTLFDRDEPRFARSAVEMVAGGDYLVPHFDGELRPDKPILIYWLMSVSIHVLGPTTLAVRLPSVLMTGLAALVTFWIGRRLYGPRTGLLAMAILATSPLMMLDGGAAISDPLLLFTLTLSLAVAVVGLERGFTWPRTVMLGVALGLGQLAKGPVALAVVGLGVLAAIWLMPQQPVRADGPVWDRPCRRRAAVRVLAAAGISLLIFLAWAIPANIATGGQFAQEGLGRHVFERMIRPQEGHGGADIVGYVALLPFYLAVIAVGFAPWVVFFPAAARSVWRGRLGEGHRRAVLAGWFLPTFILMTLVVTRLPHYVLPVWPVMAVAVAGLIGLDRGRGLDDADWRWVRRTAWFTTPAGILAALGLIVLVWGAGYGGWFGQSWSNLAAAMAPPVTALAAVLLLLTVVAAWLLRRGELRSVAATMIAGMLAILVLLATWALPVLDAFKPAPVIAAGVDEHVGRDVPMAVFGYNDPTLRFYANRTDPITILGSAEAVEQWLARPKAGILVADAADLLSAAPTLPRHVQTLFSTERPMLTSRSGRPWATLVVLLRSDPAEADDSPPSP